ncbi:MAG: flagellar protein FlaG [Gammaproteobacteria bacterium]|nr:flagellar protein FlaG [Gammaproteobacteria bacterium]
MSTIEKTDHKPATIPAAGISVRDADASQRINPNVSLSRSSAQADAQSGIDKLAARLESAARNAGHSLEFSVRGDLNRVVVTVRDEKTGEVIRQIPSETMLKLAERAAAGAVPTGSVLFDGRA